MRLGQAYGALGRLGEDRDGTIAIIFGLALIPVAFLAGAAVDYSGATDLDTKLQKATDGAALQLCLIAGNPTQAQLEAAAHNSLRGYLGSRPFRVDAVVATNNPRQIRLDTGATYQTAIVRAMNSALSTVPVKATSTCYNQQQSFEIALVLDNTGSMLKSGGGQSKMQALKVAAADFVNYVFDDPAMSTSSKISIVPFAASVAVNPATYKNASWIDDKGKASYHWSFIQGGAGTASGFTSYGVKSRFDVSSHLRGSVAAWDWNGCFESLPFPLNTQDGAPTPSNKDSYFVPMFAPDESGNGGEFSHTSGSTTVVSANSYIDDTNGYCAPTTDEATRTGQACKYMAVTNPKTTNGYTPVGPNAGCTTRPLMRMTNSRSTLLSEISAMVADGNTNTHEGFVWGWRTISPTSVFADGAAYNKPFNNKVIVLMTDGMNTWTANPYNPTLKSGYSAYGFFKNPDGSSASTNSRVPAANAALSTDAHARAAIDAMTLESCKNARAAGVVIYTVGFSVSGDPIDEQGLKMLRDCAGNSSQAFVANDSAAIVSVFQKIAQNIGALRLSK